jgi:hypothetical protein
MFEKDSIRLRYIGPDGVDGLIQGNKYDCLLVSMDNRILVSTCFPDFSKGQWYLSIKDMLANWEELN